MTHTRTLYCSFIGIFIGAFTQLNAQQALVSAGADASNANGSISFTLGEMAYIDTYDTGGSCLAGVQQTYPELPTQLTPLSNKTEFNLFPNPSSSRCTLTFSKEITSGEVIVYSSIGQQLKRVKITSPTVELSTQELAAGMYLLVLLSNNHVLSHQQLIVQ